MLAGRGDDGEEEYYQLSLRIYMKIFGGRGENCLQIFPCHKKCDDHCFVKISFPP